MTATAKLERLRAAGLDDEQGRKVIAENPPWLRAYLRDDPASTGRSLLDGDAADMAVADTVAEQLDQQRALFVAGALQGMLDLLLLGRTSAAIAGRVLVLAERAGIDSSEARKRLGFTKQRLQPYRRECGDFFKVLSENAPRNFTGDAE